MMLLLRAASFLCAAFCSHAARAERHDGIAEAITQGPPSAWGTPPEVKDDTPMALPGGLTKEEFPALGGAKKEEAVTESTTAPHVLPADLKHELESQGKAVTESTTALHVLPADLKHELESQGKAVTESTTAPHVLPADLKHELESQGKAQAVPEATVETETPASGASSPTSAHAEHFQKTVDQTSQIKDAVERVHAKTQVAKGAAVAVKSSFGKYQGSISALKGQLDGVDDAAHKFEGELLEHLAGDESARLQPFEDYQPQFGGDAGAAETAEPDVKTGDVEEPKIGEVEAPGEPPIGAELRSVKNENTAAELKESFLEGGRRMRQANETAAAPAETAAASGGNRFEKSVQQTAQIKVAVGEVQKKVELTRQAAVKVKQGFTDYKEKVVEMKNQLAEVDKQQHEYHEKLLGHFDGQEGDRMSAFENPPSLESEGLQEGAASSASTTAAAVGLLQASERQQFSKEHVKVNARGSFHAARR